MGYHSFLEHPSLQFDYSLAVGRRISVVFCLRRSASDMIHRVMPLPSPVMVTPSTMDRHYEYHSLSSQTIFWNVT